MKNIKILVSIIILLAVACFACKNKSNKSDTVIYNKDFNWTITIPKSFDTIDAHAWAKLQNKGIDIIEKTIGQDVDNASHNICIFKNDQSNYFEGNYQPYDSVTPSEYIANCHEVNDILFQTFETQMPGIKLDSLSSQETIDGLLFQEFIIKIYYPNKTVMEVAMYSRLFGQKEFGVNITSVDAEKKRLLHNAWQNSTFH